MRYHIDIVTLIKCSNFILCFIEVASPYTTHNKDSFVLKGNSKDIDYSTTITGYQSKLLDLCCEHAQ